MRRELRLFFLLTLLCSLGYFCSAVDSEEKDDIMDLLDFSTEGKNLNQIVDLLIEVAKNNIQKSGHAAIQLPNIEEEFKKRVAFIKIKGNFKAENGWFRDLSSVHRTGDATVTHSDDNMTVSIHLGLGTVQLGYDHFRVKLKRLLSVSGKIRAEVDSNSVLVRVNVQMLESGKCNLTLQDLQVTKFDGLKVRVEGKIKPVSWVMSKIATSIAKRKRENIVDKIEKRLREAAQKVLDKYHC